MSSYDLKFRSLLYGQFLFTFLLMGMPSRITLMMMITRRRPKLLYYDLMPSELKNSLKLSNYDFPEFSALLVLFLPPT